jgi:single-stranded DNA-specific DHH superfamily exonuclease
MEDLDLQTLRELEHLGPFGPGNPEPVFSVRASVRGHRVLKGRHLKLDLVPGTKTGFYPMSMEAIWFHAAERNDVMSGDTLQQEAEWAGVPELNRFRGQITPTFRVRDRRPV